MERKRISNGGISVAKSSALLGTHIWVRIDLIETIVNNGGILPPGWNPRKRIRPSPKFFTNQQYSNNDENNNNTWGWCRARVASATTPHTSPDKQMNNVQCNNVELSSIDEGSVNPFSKVILRKTNKLNQTPSRGSQEKDQESWRGSPERIQKLLSITITVDDEELAPSYLNNVTVSFTYETSDSSIVCMANAWWQPELSLKFSDDNITNQCLPPEDLTTLEQLHEPAVVFCLQKRYEMDQIYTYTGKVLLALNPFRAIENIYDENTMRMYWNDFVTCSTSNKIKGRDDNPDSEFKRPPPHVYAIAEDAYRSAILPLQQFTPQPKNGRAQHQNGCENQSILVSGESGAGKTVTTKIILRYLATLSAESHRRENSRESTISNIESQVLESNPILESFGNARTVRNDNSSRFGKFMEMQFDGTGCLVSASIETYLLEKVRLVSQSPGERNYHVFYEVMCGLDDKNRKRFCIYNKTATDFRMTAISSTFDRRDGVSDLDTFDELLNALNTVGFSKSEQDDLFHVVCALLHASNLTFCERNQDGSALDMTNPSLQPALTLLGVDSNVLNDALTRCAIIIKDDVVYKNLTVDRAIKAIEALIKITYGALFSLIVKKVNSFIAFQAPNEESTHMATKDASTTAQRRVIATQKKIASIGVLDIFGFESFDKNSFEQLCINYCNEALQQQFNLFVFKLEQKEYENEGIEWSFIEFPDNQDVLDLIDKKHDGILSILDEQSRLPRCTDATFAEAVYSKLINHPRLVVSNTQRASFTFSINHYAGLVEYNSECFLEKNKDELPKETTELLMSSCHSFLSMLGRELSHCTQTTEAQIQPGYNNKGQIKRSGSSIMRDSVGIQFCSQLRALRTRIETTSPHYIRCLKPNDDLVPFSFNNLVIADQLRCAGVLEAIRVSRIGFPHRYFHEHFLNRYMVLGQSRMSKFSLTRVGKPSCKDSCEILVQILANDVRQMLRASDGKSLKGTSKPSSSYHGIQLGKTKVFVRTKAFEALEFFRSKKFEDSAIAIQSSFRMAHCRNLYIVKYASIIRIQNFARQIKAHVKQREERLRCAVKKIASFMRCYQLRRRFKAVRVIAIWCQSAFRGAVARQYCAYLFLDRNAEIIQRAWRKFSLTFTFRRIRHSIIQLQNKQRSRLAIRELCRLRREAKDLASVAAERDKFKEESIRLRQELDIARKLSPVKSKHPERETEIMKLRCEVQKLHFELEKTNRYEPRSKRNEENTKRLIEELADREDELDRLKRELDTLRARDESSSIRSITVATSCASEFSYRIPRPRTSPTQSDTSLLDDEDEDIVVRDCSSQGEPYDNSNSLFGIDHVQYLHNAIRKGDLRRFDHVLSVTSEPCVLINQSDKDGRTAIHIASIALNIEIAEALLAKGAVVNAQDDDGETPLHLAESAAMTYLLLTKGKANPNIPNVDGICALHLAVQRRDLESVRLLVSKHANINNADNVRWFTSLHLIALPARMSTDCTDANNIRLRIARALSSTVEQNVPDFNYQDNEGNTPLHYAVQLDTQDCCDLVSLFLERGANPNIRNGRDQIPLHLLCHNIELRRQNNFQEIIHVMLMNGADPNIQSSTGCTPLHLSLYHKDVETAIQLVHSGAELHMVWKKPKRWPCFWKDMGSSRVTALDMIDDSSELYRILASITSPHRLPPTRRWCMECKKVLGSNGRSVNCRHCSRLTCDSCAQSCLPPEYFLKNFKVTEPSWVCIPCEKILTTQKEAMSNVTHPISFYGDDDDDEDRFSC